MTLGNMVVCMCAQVLVYVNILMANSRAVTAEYKEKDIVLGLFIPIYNVKFGHVASDNHGHHFLYFL